MPPAEDKPNALAADDVSTEHKPSPRETVSLKRGREGSVDILANESFSAAHKKKNRLEEDAPEPHSETDEDAGSQNAAEPPKEGRTVGEVRRKVQEMNWKEGEPRPSDDATEKAETDDKPSDQSSKTMTAEEEQASTEGPNAVDSSKKSEDADASDWVKVDASEAASDDAAAESDAPSLKRKANDDATAGATAVEEKKRKSTSPTPNDPSSPTPTTETATDAAPAPSSSEAPKKPQATFGSFSSKPSPFAALGSGTSAFGAAAASGKSAFGEAASKPSAFGAAASKPANSFGGKGFGSYSSAFSPFAAKKPADSTDDKAGPSTSFGDILKEKGDDEAATEEKKPQLDRQEVPTGEEEEETMYQTRAKLFMMEDEGTWKERGVGLLKLNKRREDGGGARLVMRADGVLRVILNSLLYVGMSCLEDGKHVRMTIFEGGERRFVTIRTASPKVATELASAIHEHTPLESTKKATSKSPGGPEDSAV